jgi:hypothetical protein
MFGAGSGSHSATHATSKADIRGNFNYDTGLNTAQFAKGNFYALGASSSHSLSASGGGNGHPLGGSNNVGGSMNSSSINFGGVGIGADGAQYNN